MSSHRNRIEPWKIGLSKGLIDNSLGVKNGTNIARKRQGPWTVAVVAVVVHQVGLAPLPEEVEVPRQEEAELNHTDFVPTSNPSQLATRGIIRTKNELEKPIRLEDRRRGGRRGLYE